MSNYTPASRFTASMMHTLEAFVQEHLGLPWVDECWDLARGADCWSWVHHCYRACGIDLPPNIWAAKSLFVPVAAPGAPGDALYFEAPGLPRPHLGIRLRGLYVSDCNWGGSGVAIHDLTRGTWAECLKGAWRYSGETP